MLSIELRETRASEATPDAVRNDAHQTRSQLLSTLYPPPYEAFGGLAARHFGDRVGHSLARCLTDRVMGDTDTSDLHWLVCMYLTPELDEPGPTLITAGDKMAEVIAELSPHRWENSSPRTKRELLLKKSAAALSHLSEHIGFAQQQLEAALEQALGVPDDLRRLDRDLRTDRPVRLRSDIIDELTGPTRFIDLDIDRKRQLGTTISDALADCGIELVSVGTADTPAGVVPRFVDPKTKLVFHLIPGGAFEPGFDESMLRLARPWFEYFDEFDAPMVRLYGSDAICDLRRRARVKVAPMLVATSCIPDPHPDPYRQQFGGLDAWKRISWPEAARRCLDRGWSLPSDVEFEWFLRATGPKIYPWGDDATPIIGDVIESAQQIAELYGERSDTDIPPLDESMEPMDYYCRSAGFGLDAPLGFATWCLPDVDDEATPLITRGGALDTYPWQGGYESAAFFTAANTRRGLDLPEADPGACLRPVIRLQRR